MSGKVGTTELKGIWEDSSLRGFLGEVKRRHGIVDTLALPNMRDLPPIRIESLFVQPLLAKEPVSATLDPANWPAGEALFDILQSIPRLVLLGDPGSGKTTLANWLAWRLSAGLTSPLPKNLVERIPIPCVLRELPASAFEKISSILDLALVVADHLMGQKTSGELNRALRARVHAKQYVLILDGIDEIPIVYRKKVSKWIQLAADDDASVLATTRIVGYDDCPVDRPEYHLTSYEPKEYLLPIGEYREKSLKELTFTTQFHAISDVIKDIIPVPEVNLRKTKVLRKGFGDFEFIYVNQPWAEIRYLMPFDEKRIEIFVENWYLQRSGSEREARSRSEDLIFSLNQSGVTQELARTPNLLSLMAIVHRERAHLPDGKALLYKEIANAYINTIDQYRKIAPDDLLAPFGWEIRERWIAYVGFMMQMERQSGAKGKDSSGVLVEEKKVLEWLTSAMEMSGIGSNQLSAVEFLKWVARRSGLLLPRGEGRFAFVHLSFQEYFCARFIAGRIVSPTFVRNKESENAKVTRSQLMKWSTESVWREIFVSLFELISGERDAEWVEDLAEILFGDVNKEEYFEFPLAELATRCLTNRHINFSSQRRRILAQSSSLAALSETFNEFGNFDVLRALWVANYAVIDSKNKKYSRFVNSNLHKSILNLDERQNILILVAHDVENVIDLRQYPALRMLDLAGSKLEDIAPISNMKDLKLLDVSRTAVEDMECLSNLKNIWHLEMAKTNISRLLPLKGLRGLRHLDASSTKISNISVLKNFHSLKWLHLQDTRIKNIQPLSELAELSLLDLSRTRVQNIEALSKLSNLSLLFANGTKIEDLSPISESYNLMWLSFSRTAVKNIKELKGLKQLMYLNLNGTPVDDLSPLEECEKLDELVISDTNISDISVLKSCSNLRIVNLSGSKVIDVSPLKDLKSLKILNISNTSIENVAVLSQGNGLRIIR